MQYFFCLPMPPYCNSMMPKKKRDFRFRKFFFKAMTAKQKKIGSESFYSNQHLRSTWNKATTAGFVRWCLSKRVITKKSKMDANELIDIQTHKIHMLALNLTRIDGTYLIRQSIDVFLAYSTVISTCGSTKSPTTDVWWLFFIFFKTNIIFGI